MFPSGSAEGHFNGDTAKDQHALAITNSKVKKFEPYVLRHTALTNLAAKGCDALTLARIAGHSSITITQRYIHPQADAIDRAFAALDAKPVLELPEHSENSQVGTNTGTAQKQAEAV